MSSITVNNVTRTVEIKSTGTQGPAGVAWIGDWALATDYSPRNGVYHDGSSYRATAVHTSSADTEPGVGADWEDYWALVALGTDPDDVAAAEQAAQEAAEDALATAADRIATGEDRVQTGLDRTATGQDAAATAADRVQTGIDRATAVDSAATAVAKEILTDADALATAADRVQTGLDRTASVAARDASIAAAEGSGATKFYATKAAATAALGGLANGTIVDVFVDESQANARTTYEVVAGALTLRWYYGYRVFPGTSDTATRNIVSGYSGNSVAAGDQNVILGGGSLASENIISGNSNLRTIIGAYDQEIEASLASSIIHSPHSVIRAAATHAQIAGGSTGEISNGDYNAIYSGTQSVISTSGDANTIIGGTACQITAGAYNLLNGYQNTITGGTIGGNFVAGYQNTGISGNYGAVWGRSNTKSADYATVFGYQGVGRTAGALTMSGGQISAAGDAQANLVPIKRTTSDAATNYLTGPDNNQFIALPSDNFAVRFRAEIVAYELATGASKSWTLVGLVKRVGGTSSIVGAVTKTADHADAGAAAWDVGANISTNNLRVAGIGEAAKTIHWAGLVTFLNVA